MTTGSDTTSYRMCQRCVMDTTVPDIEFGDGTCNHCRRYEQRVQNETFSGDIARDMLARTVAAVKKGGRGKPYDCIIGVSGGIDSTMIAYHVKKLGLRPLAVHLDNGWNSELAVSNIEQTLKVLGIDLYTHVVEWDEFKDLQIAFLRASVPNAEIPSDHAILAFLYRMAAKHRVRYIVNGSNLATEGLVPTSWMYWGVDLRHIKAIHRRFGRNPLRTYHGMPLVRWIHYTFVKRIKFWRILNYVDYNKEEAKQLLQKELGWRDYGHKHYESIYTRFFQAYILPRKFDIDKRKAHFSTLICAGTMTRDEALAELKKPPYPPDMMEQDLEYVVKKLGLTEKEFEEIMALPPKRHSDYPNNGWLYDRLSYFVALATRWATRV